MVLLENVRNLLSHDRGNTFRVIRSVLTEELGCRIAHRVSVAQTDEMAPNGLQLVVPAALHRTFSALQAEWLKDVRDFLGVLAERQARAVARG